MTVRETLGDGPARQVRVLATDIDDGVLEGPGDIGVQLVSLGRRRLLRLLLQRGQGEGLEAGETEIVARPVQHRPRQVDGNRITRLDQLRDRRPAGFVEGTLAEQVEAAVEAYLGTEVQPIGSMFDYMFAELPEGMEEQRDTAERYAGTGGH